MRVRPVKRPAGAGPLELGELDCAHRARLIAARTFAGPRDRNGLGFGIGHDLIWLALPDDSPLTGDGKRISAGIGALDADHRAALRNHRANSHTSDGERVGVDGDGSDLHISVILGVADRPLNAMTTVDAGCVTAQNRVVRESRGCPQAHQNDKRADKGRECQRPNSVLTHEGISPSRGAAYSLLLIYSASRHPRAWTGAGSGNLAVSKPNGAAKQTCLQVFTIVLRPQKWPNTRDIVYQTIGLNQGRVSRKALYVRRF